MNKIEFPRVSYDGKRVSQPDVENWYVNQISNEISKKLPVGTAPQEQDCISDILNNFKKYILAKPEELQNYRDYIDKKYTGIFRKTKKNGSPSEYTTDFCKSILEAFNYEKYRNTVLVELAQKLNVKTCPYCNMHYTLFAETEDSEIKGITKFEYDHFIDKSQYPQLSMSLYNLIPSCPVCNHSKRTKHLSINFNPYYSAINKHFHFAVNEPLPLIMGEKKPDKIKVDLIPDDVSSEELNEFQKAFNIKLLYSRHGDIAQEVFDKAYEEEYYKNPENFTFLNSKSSEYLQRLWIGTYINEDEIEKRPMTKYIQDLWKQAKNGIN